MALKLLTRPICNINTFDYTYISLNYYKEKRLLNLLHKK